MRLINVRTLELQWFNDDAIPKYAILSHTWGSDEVNYQEFVWISKARAISASPNLASTQDAHNTLMLALELMIRGSSGPGGLSEEDLLKRVGYSKILNAAEQAQGLGCNYLWVDTCCIDKTSSAELQEAINSMYRWYRDAEVCIVYLGDIPKPRSGNYTTASEIARASLKGCRWARRGWTLQELIAPIVCRFYFQDWTLMGEKVEFLEELSDATGIPVRVLDDRNLLSEVSIAERMSWAAHRQSTRIEDVAYCLLGIFDIHMPLLYGEGSKAFIRLQEEILRTTDDYSLFAWCATTSEHSTYRGLLARHPEEFQHCRSVEHENVVSTFPIGFTPIGLRVQFEFLPDQDKSRVLAMIRSSNQLNQRLAITLKCLDGGMQYARVDAGALVPIDDWPTGKLHTIYVRQKPSIPPDFTTTEFKSFHIRRRVSNQATPNVRIISVTPRNAWDETTHELRIPDHVTEFWGAVMLRVQSAAYAHSLSFPVAFGFNRSTCHYWCKAIPNFTPPQDGQTSGTWPQAVKRRIPDEVYDPLRGTDFGTNKDGIFTTGATHMAHIHNAILRGYNTIYLQAPHVREVDKTAFVGYAQTWYRFIKSHHDDEEAELFPKVEDMLRSKDIWKETHEEHESFLSGLASYNTYLNSLSSPQYFNGKELVSIMDSFQTAFMHHFHHEISTIAAFADHPSAPAPNTPEAELAATVFKAWGKKTVTKAGTFDVVPFFLMNLDATFEDGRWANWPPMPAPVRWGLVNVAGSVHWTWWKFSSCDGGGRPKELYALEREDEE
ncbi:hypothetical protein J4E82_002525 [Alternaria postmessia]|uniref:uncharacterized protein n=1 Tax=Alternaria postmessia TaxID=1187938 RepID=UPI0022259548|nr:uncharacterized protein J4E82_002525 [Alternaria postmessia]KAI5378639.1 hypothetical protein J4E82_002525 [Alternaria postmessia]